MEFQSCRICSCQIVSSKGYNIFKDEYFINNKTDGKIKLYICLNNFIHEKLYEEDEFSSLICPGCCVNLKDSYSFMLRVRVAEQNLKFGTRLEPQTLSLSLSAGSFTTPTPTKQECEEEIELTEEILESEELDPDENDIEEEIENENPQNLQEILEIQPVLKKPKVTRELPDTIIVTNYELEQFQEKEQSVFMLNVGKLEIDRPKDGCSLTFDVTFISHEDPNSIYKCRHCVKAFSNCQFLLKHTISCHLCLFCLETCENYKSLGKHLNHPMNCQFCDKNCETVGSYRQHLRKIHALTLPAHIGILER